MKLNGIAASPGLADGKAFVFRNPELTFNDHRVDDVPAEIQRVRVSAEKSVSELISLKESVRNRLGDEYAHIFRSQQTIAEDENIIDEVETCIREGNENAENALSKVFGGYISLFSELDDADYNKSRVTDIEDVYTRILRILLGVENTSLAEISAGTVVFAEELFPSDTAMMDTGKVVGMITEQGGATSHVAILANNLGIPAAVGVRGVMDKVQSGDDILLDATDPEIAGIFINPDKKIISDFQTGKQTLEKRQSLIMKEHGKPSVTRDGLSITLSANIGSPPELKSAWESGASGIGLYRSEFLFMNNPSLPSEEVQFQAYREAAEKFKDGFVIIRTLDIGGDKQLASLPLPEELNPFLGMRALRLTLSRPELFLTQAKAILRAGVYGNVKIMFPMISGVPELDRALELLEDAKKQLDREEKQYNPHVETGIMIEVPSAVFCAEALAKRVSFFSIGTNDLTQYLLAADRLNSDVAEYYRIFDPSVFRAIREVVTAAIKTGKWVGVCGELGGNPLAIPILVGLGVTELSMSARSLAEANWLVRGMTSIEIKELTDRILELETDREIRDALHEYYKSKESQ